MKSQSVERAHRVPAAEPHALVDVLAGGEALLVHPHRRHQVGDEQHVDDEAGAVLGADRLLADLLGERVGARHRRLRGVERDDHLDQLHHRHRAEEVQAEDALGAVGGAGELGDRDRGGVGGDQRRRRQPAGDRGEDLALELGVLGHRLDHELGTRRARRGRWSRVDRASDRPRRSSSLPPSTARATERSIRSRERSSASSPTRGASRPMPAAGGRLGDARAHEAAADDADPADRHRPGDVVAAHRRDYRHPRAVASAAAGNLDRVGGALPYSAPPVGMAGPWDDKRERAREMSMRRVGSVLIVAMVALATVILPSTAGATGKGKKKDVARYILPPGNYGGLPPTDNSTDQLPLYDGLTPLRGNVTDADIDELFLPEDFPPIGRTARGGDRPARPASSSTTRTASPTSTARPATDVAFGAGWVTPATAACCCELGRGPARAAVADVPGHRRLLARHQRPVVRAERRGRGARRPSRRTCSFETYGDEGPRDPRRRPGLRRRHQRLLRGQRHRPARRPPSTT